MKNLSQKSYDKNLNEYNNHNLKKFNEIQNTDTSINNYNLL